MSLDSATVFFTTMMQDDEILDLVVQATEGKQGVERQAALVSVGTERGYEFNLEEAGAVQDMIEGLTALSDEELGTVSGGVTRETVRSDRQLTSTQFQNANQQSTQYVNMLSSVLKTMNETQTSIIRNLK